MPSVHYELLSTCPHTGARRGRLYTPHGTVETPFFMPVGTQGTVKTVGSEDVEKLGFEQVLEIEVSDVQWISHGILGTVLHNE